MILAGIRPKLLYIWTMDPNGALVNNIIGGYPRVSFNDAGGMSRERNVQERKLF